ncbi:MAG: ribosome-associated translation inhibitor RaiA [Paracoccaceae bacterium]|nr:ribosome-associated translation inhibitor RaiA [Paracoccaceae bacterium]
MRFQIIGKHMNVGESLSGRIREVFEGVLNKFAIRPVEVVVTLSRDRHEYVCDSSVHLSTGLSANAGGRATDLQAAFDMAADRMEKQLRRHKRRLKDHHRKRTSPIESTGAPQYILASHEDIDESSGPESFQPVIIAEMETDIKSISVGEAVMQMELAGEPVLVFRNESNGGMNVVYRRNDGNIGWIDPGTND